MALERETFKWGALVLPLDDGVASGYSLLRDADPAVFWALDFWAAVLQLDLGARWSVAATAAGLTSVAANIVQGKVPFDPGPYLTSDQFKFPLLAVYRKSSKAKDQSEQWERTDDVWGVDFVLPTLTPAQAEQLLPALNAAKAVLVHRTTEGHHADYLAGAEVWDSDHAGVMEIGFTSFSIGDWKLSDRLSFPTLHAEVAVSEMQGVPSGAFEALAGTDTEIALEHTDGDVRHVADVETPDPLAS